VGSAPPRIGQTGRNVIIPLTPDIRTEPTQVRIGSQPADFIAESPRQCVVRVPANVPAGPTSLEVSESMPDRQQKVETSKFNVVSVGLTADKLNLIRGESTQLHVTVNGLNGLEDYTGNIDLGLVIKTPQVVRFNSEAGSRVVKVIYLRDRTYKGRTGILRIDEQIIGVNAGGFQIEANLFDETGPVKGLEIKTREMKWRDEQE